MGSRCQALRCVKLQMKSITHDWVHDSPGLSTRSTTAFTALLSRSCRRVLHSLMLSITAPPVGLLLGAPARRKTNSRCSRNLFAPQPDMMKCQPKPWPKAGMGSMSQGQSAADALAQKKATLADCRTWIMQEGSCNKGMEAH